MLTRRAQFYTGHGKQDLAFRDLKEALSLAPQDRDIVNTLRNLQITTLDVQTESPENLMDKFVKGDEDAGQRIISGFSSEPFVQQMTRGTAVEQLFSNSVQVEQKTAGMILLKLSQNVDNGVSANFVRSVSNRFPDSVLMFIRCGSMGIEALTNILLKNWDDNKARANAFNIAIEKFIDILQQSSDEATQVAILNSLIRTASSNQSLIKSVDKIPFEIIFPLLSDLQPQSVRSRAIVLFSTLISKEAADSTLISTLKSRLSDFVTKKISDATPRDYITAFSTLTSIFTIRSEISAKVFLQEGFLEEVVEEPVEVDDNGAVTKSLLEMLSAATIDKNCRVKIVKVAEGLLRECAQSTEAEIRALAGSVLAKLSSAMPGNRNVGVDLLKIFKSYPVKNETALLSTIEGLAFSSTVPTTKVELAKDSDFLKYLMTILKSPGQRHALVYGCLSIIVNLTSYKPALSEEQKRINEIRRLAKEENVYTVDEFDKDIHVAARCKCVLAAGLMPSLNAMALNSSPACITAISHILLSTSTAVANRGLLAHQGAIKLILALLGKPVDQQTKITFTHALAKILISVNPSLVFSSRTPITAPIQPLTDLLTTESLPNELPRFEGLLALTNLASADETARTIIIDKTWPVTETLLLSDTPLIQRAATELVCNLVASQKGVDKFIPSAKNSSATSRLHLLLALADVDDVSTRSAAGGALAMLTGNKEVCNALGEVERSLERVAGMVDDQDEGVAFRGTVCVAKLIENGGGKMNKRLQQAGLSEKLRMYMKRSTNPKAKVLCGEVLDCLA